MVLLIMKVGNIKLEKGINIMFNLEDNWFVIDGNRRYCDNLFNCLKALNAAIDPIVVEACLTTGFFNYAPYRICHEFWMED